MYWFLWFSVSDNINEIDLAIMFTLYFSNSTKSTVGLSHRFLISDIWECFMQVAHAVIIIL